MFGNVLFITADQWRGDSLGCVNHPFLSTPTLDELAADGVLFRNHFANTAPCGPSRASLYTGMYAQNHRSILNGTPLDACFDNVALLARRAGYVPALFGYTDTSVVPRTVAPDDPQLQCYEGVLPGFDPVVNDPELYGSLRWAEWLRSKGVDTPPDVQRLYEPRTDVAGTEHHGASWAPTQFAAEHTETAFMIESLIGWLEERENSPFFAHLSLIRPHAPFRNPLGYHDLYSADLITEFVGCESREEEMSIHPLNRLAIDLPGVGCPISDLDRRQQRVTYHAMQREVDDQLARLITYLKTTGLYESTLIIFTSDHGEMGGDHWLQEKLGYWDQSYHIPLIVRDPRADATRGQVVNAFTESVDLLPTIADWVGEPIPLQCDGHSLAPLISSGEIPAHWRDAVFWEWSFADPEHLLPETLLGIPSSHCALNVVRTATHKYVQFAADSSVFEPLLFDLTESPHESRNLIGTVTGDAAAFQMAQRLIRWRMRNDERTLSSQFLSESKGLISRSS